MKTRMFQWMMAATLICGAAFFTACIDKNDDPYGPVIENLDQKIVGKWIVNDLDGQPAPTNKKIVFTFVSDTKAYMTASLNWNSKIAPRWLEKEAYDVAIDGDMVTLSTQRDAHTTVMHEFAIIDIDDTEFTTEETFTKTVDGEVVATQEEVVRFLKVSSDFSEAIIGTWQGHCTSEGSVFDDGQEHRWQYKADGTYVYYRLDDNNEWQPSTDTLNEYFVDGNLLCTRWSNAGSDVENREWWEITIDHNNQMKWTALRQDDKGGTYTASFEMTKVN